MTRLSRRQVGGALLGVVVLPVLGRPVRSGPVSHTITIRKFAFVPTTLTIRAGDTVIWTNEDIAPHTATARDGTWDTSALARGESASVTFPGPGRTDYVCAFHPNMTGEIVVEDAA